MGECEGERVRGWESERVEDERVGEWKNGRVEESRSEGVRG